MSDAPLVAEFFPELAAEIEELLRAQHREALANQVPGLRIVERCHCGDDFCATVYTVPKPKGAWRIHDANYENFKLDSERGTLILTVLHNKIAQIEILDRDEIRKKLNEIIPIVKRK